MAWEGPPEKLSLADARPPRARHLPGCHLTDDEVGAGGGESGLLLGVGDSAFVRGRPPREPLVCARWGLDFCRRWRGRPSGAAGILGLRQASSVGTSLHLSRVCLSRGRVVPYYLVGTWFISYLKKKNGCKQEIQLPPAKRYWTMAPPCAFKDCGGRADEQFLSSVKH